MLFAIIAVIFFLLQNISNKEFTRRFATRLPGLTLFNALALTLMMVLMACIGGAIAVPMGMLLLAAAFGVLFVITICLLVTAMSIGPLGATALIANMSMVIPVATGILFWHEELTWLKGIGILFMVAVLVLSAQGGKRYGKAASFRWFLIAVTEMGCNGILSIMQRTYAIRYPQVPVQAMNFWLACFGSVLCWGLVLFFWLRGERYTDWRPKAKTFTLLASCVGMGTAGGIVMQMLALTVLPSIVCFPMVQGGVILGLWASSMLFYGEAKTRSGFLALALGIAGIVLLNL